MDGASRYGRALLRVAATLVLLARIAEHAAGRSLPARILALFILRHAEAVALAFVAGETRLDLSRLDDGPRIGGHAVDAAWLALRFRMLAEILVGFVDAGRRPGGVDRCDGAAPRRLAPGRLPLLMPGRPRPPDTS